MKEDLSMCQAMDKNLLEMKQLFFNNLLLLGFDVVALEATNHIPFNKNMFDLPNKRGAEIVLHFLFERLNPTMCRESFRDIWPILDKKREQAFRKTCANWLANIAREETDNHLPRVNASLFMSPGGDKFYQLLFYFSEHVLQKIAVTELGCKSLNSPKFLNLSSQNMQLDEVMMKEKMCSAARYRKNYFDGIQLTVKAGKTWKETADEYVKDSRKLSKEIRELEYEMREEEQRAVQNSVSRGSPTKKYGKLENLDPNFDPRTIQRAQRVQHVRDMWKQLDDFERTEAAEREIIESIVERTINKHKIDAADIPFKVPDMLLRECEQEIRRRNVSNTYQGGKLNLESVLQLWNLSLKLYLEKLKEVGMPKYENEVDKLRSQVNVQQSYLQKAGTLRSQMSERIPVLQASVKQLREHLDNAMFKDESPSVTRTTSFGLELVEPSPVVNFSPSGAVTPAQPIEVPRLPDFVDTPQASDRITEEMRESSKAGPKQLFGGDIDLFTQQGPKESAIPKPGSSKGQSQPSSRHSSRPTSARSTASTRGSKKSTQSSVRSTTESAPKQDRDMEFPTVSSPRTLVGRMNLGVEKLDISAESLPLSARSIASSRTLSARSDLSARSASSASTAKASQSPRSVKSHSSGRLSARSHDSDTGRLPMVKGRKSPTDLLVDEIMGEGKILSPFNSGLEAFESRNMVNRTPELEEENKENLQPEPVHGHQSGLELGLGSNTNNNYLDEAVSVSDNDFINQQRNEDVDNNLENYVYNYDVERFDGVGGTGDGEDHRRTSGDGEPAIDKEGGDSSDIDGVEFEEILGPELDEEYDNDVNMSDSSHRSGEQIVVIDKSLHISPKSTKVKEDPWSDEEQCFIEEERFPSLETSPREAIVIDHSFHRPPAYQDSNTPGFLSQSLQTQTVNLDQVRKDLLSKSLEVERSPLCDEIREMFDKAVAETPPRGHSRSVFERHVDRPGSGSRRQIDVLAPVIPGYCDREDYGEDGLELPNMDIHSRQKQTSPVDLQPGNISWELSENLEDIEMPDFNMDREAEGHFDNENDGDNESSTEINESDKDADTEKKTIEDGLEIPGVSNLEDINDFFLDKTPELPSKFQSRVIKSPGDGGQGDFMSSDRSSIEILPKFPEMAMEEPPEFMSFTP